MEKKKGSFTLPGEAGYEELTLKLAERWGADVIRDSDGTEPLISSSMELVIKILASFVFVPLWGYAGASVAEPFSWLLCMLFLLFSYIRIMKKEKIYS